MLGGGFTKGQILLHAVLIRQLFPLESKHFAKIEILKSVVTKRLMNSWQKLAASEAVPE
jgi:hypothetical protein